MALTVATNTGALMAQAAASSVNKEMEISMERLATGKRINGASDDAAGVAIASRLTSEIRGTNQAIRNAMDGQALIDTAEGAHVEVETILQRMRELAVQASNDTNDANDRANIQAEMDALTTEIDRIASTTSWAGQALLDGATPYDGSGVTTLATAHSDAASFSFQVGSGTTSKDSVTANIGAVGSTALSIAGSEPATGEDIDLTSLTTATISNTASSSTATSAVTASFNSPAAGADLVLTFTSAGTQTTSSSATVSTSTTNLAATYASGAFTFELEGTDVTVTIGAGGTNSLKGGIAEATKDAIDALGLTGVTTSVTAGAVTISKASALDVTSSSAATTAITAIDTAITTINSQRAELGALTNRLDSTVSNLTNISNNLQAGRGRIEDADFASETTNLAKSQILQQASTAMLAQANASKQNVLSLLQG